MKAGFVGVIGLANAGKSTLVNQLVGEKVAIVSAKPQTTRKRVLGVYTSEQGQILFVDSPGLIEGKAKGLHSFLQAESMDVIDQSDALMVVLNIDAPQKEELERVVKLAKDSGKPWMVVIHKSDLPQIHRAQLIRDSLGEGVAVFEFSSKNADKEIQNEIIKQLFEMLPESPAVLYDPDLWTLQNTRELAAEIIREKTFNHLHQEIPFGSAVRIIKFEEPNEKDITKIYAEIMVAKENHRPIVIGKGGSQLKTIGTEARQELEKILGSKIYLDLHVAVKKNWTKNDVILEELGYVVKDSPT